MKKFERGILWFLGLVLVLSAGISYLGLNQATKNKSSSDDTQKMAVALVNEDEGAQFKGNNYQFGNQFIKSIEQDNNHDWYVVSRGVAESGLKRNVYNLMIVIPNDFTQRALALDSKNPEQVTLNYKINASGNSNLKAEAEKTASSILGDLNRRIIDVYFASVIGNLQDAQDNISTLVNKETAYTSVYNNAVHRPLENYTSQFGAIQDNTNILKESFKGLQGLLKDFETGLGEGVKINESYQSNFSNFAKIRQANALISNNFSKQLTHFDEDLNSSDVVQQTNNLVAVNEAINNYYQNELNGSPNMLTSYAAMQSFLKTTSDKVTSMNTDIVNRLSADMQKALAEKLRAELKTANGTEKFVYLNEFFSKPNDNALNSIKNQIDKLPSLNPVDIDQIGLQPSTVIQLKNVIAVTNQFDNEFNYIPNGNKNSTPLADIIRQLKDVLADTANGGVYLEDTVIIPEDKKDGQEFTLTIPDDFTVQQVLLTLPNGQQGDYTESLYNDGKITLPKNEKGPFSVKVKVNLKDSDRSIDVFQPLNWSWQLKQLDVTHVDTPAPPPEDPGDGSTPPTDGNPGDGSTPPADGGPGDGSTPPADGGPGDGGTPSADESPDGSTSSAHGSSTDGGTLLASESPGDGSTLPADENPGDGGTPPADENPGEGSTPPTDGSPSDPNTDPVKPVEVVNNLISHQVMSPLGSGLNGKLVQGVSDTVTDYQKMLMLYSLYFGLDLSSNNLTTMLSQKSLKDLASIDSLYYLFNKQDIVDILANYIAGQTVEEVRKETQDLKTKVDNYTQLVNQALQNSDQMAQMIQQTTSQALQLNTSLGEMLKQLSLWRDESLKLQDSQSTILQNGNDEQTAVIALDDQFKSLLMASQSLSTESLNNINSANEVYDTFDAIDQQARDIQISGTTLVTKANNLSTNLTDKVTKDQNFAKNFAGVLANSRIGKRPNENLFNFLSNPVQTKNSGLIVAKASDVFTPYFIVLICFIITLFTSYVLSNYERKRLQKDTFEQEKSLLWSNLPMTIITTGIAIVEGLMISIISGYFLEIAQEKYFLWIGLITLVMVAMLLVATYLLRQLKMAGMFILLVIMSIYLFFTEALGLHFDKLSLAYKIREYSPLQYIEKLVGGFADGGADNQMVIFVLFGLILISLVGHLLVLNGYSRSEVVEDEEISQAL